MMIEHVVQKPRLPETVCLNPYSNGMIIEQEADRSNSYVEFGLNPYSNGMIIEHSWG